MRILKVCSALLLLLTAACGGGEKPRPDAGVDDSCGIDCAAQAHFGVMVGRCFEYSKTAALATPPDLGVLVEPVVTLEGGVKAIPVSYREGGIKRMEDLFTFKNGDLYLVRRTWQGSESVTYEDGSDVIVGVLWASRTLGPGQNLSTQATADFIRGANRTADPTTYGITTTAASTTELKTPAEQFTLGLKLLFSETPNHGADTRRVFVPEKGFVLFASPLQIGGGTAQEFKLQNVKDLPAGTFECG